MLSGKAGWTTAGLSAVAATLLFVGESSRAQCGGGRPMQNRPTLQTAMMPAMPRPPQNPALMGMQPPNAFLVAALQQPQPNAFPAAGLPQQNVLAAPRRPQQPNAAVQLRPLPAAEPQGPAPNPEDPADTAARQVRMAGWLADEADKVQKGGEADLATRLRQRAGERLQNVVARYPGTRAADEAQELLEKWGR